ncbi:hypothetical protein KC906_01535 [Candidatus Kaiserbacteria bacterium]|nr:hypothetical protein [Candidatus Kaiserbacteria bacterium]
MSYNNDDFPRYVRTAGKITVLTALIGLLVFVVAFVFDFGAKELSKVSAQTATTTLTVLNTPPTFDLNPYEVVGSATTTPTNSGDEIQWAAIATDANGADWFLLVCSTNASPTPNQDAPPVCGAGAVQWAVSASTTSGALGTAATTTEEWGTGQFNESNNWYAWACDADSVDPRCIVIPEQGDYATSTSPFNINRRPVFSPILTNTGPADPGADITWNSTSTDPDLAGGEDTLYLIVCSSNSDYSTTTNTCANDFIASTTLTSILSDAAATYTLPAIIRDQGYSAYGYIVDEHGHEASANPLQSNFAVNNVAPTVLNTDIDLNGGANLVLTIPAGETPSSTLDFTIRDANSCYTAASSSEITDYIVTLYHGTTTDPITCDGTGTNYDPNDCYDSAVGASTWNLTCVATSTCVSPLQDYVDYACEFPLWFVADPTDASAPLAFYNDDWFAAVAGVDNNYATGTLATTSSPVDLNSFTAIDILAQDITYGGIEPGNDTGTLSASSTALNVGNTGLDQQVSGESMCGTYSPSTECPALATSTIPDWRQQFSTTSYAYDVDALEGGAGLDGGVFQLASSSYQQLELDVQKTTSTSTPQTGVTWWGIAVPASITLAGSYTGLNSFIAVTAEPSDW